MIRKTGRRLMLGSVAAIGAAVMMLLLSGPGGEPISSDPRTFLCGSDCFPVSHPWLLILAGVVASAGLIGLRNAMKSNTR